MNIIITAAGAALSISLLTQPTFAWNCPPTKNPSSQCLSALKTFNSDVAQLNQCAQKLQVEYAGLADDNSPGRGSQYNKDLEQCQKLTDQIYKDLHTTTGPGSVRTD
jgi:hypothetical protein